MIHVRIKLFAAMRDIAGTGDITLALPESSSANTALEMLCEQYPALCRWKEHLRVAVNCEYTSSSFTLHDGDELAIIPPVSGG